MKNIILISTALMICTLMQAQEGFKTKSISIFKNGSAFYIKNATVNTKDGGYTVSEGLPAPLFGTFWMFSKSKELNGISSFDDDVKKKTDVISIHDMLLANLGSEVTLFSGEDQLKGKIEKVNAKIVVLSNGGKWSAVELSGVRKMELESEPNMQFDLEQKQKVLHVNFLSKKPKQELDLMYMQKGLGWLPNYLIELKDEKTAQLTLRAAVINDAEDIENTDISFVVGVPNFKYAHMVSPLFGTKEVASFLGGLGNRYSNLRNEMDNFGNSIASQSISYNVDEDWAGNSFTPSSVDGASHEDLYFYNIKNVSLKKGGRALHTILQTEVPIEHIYEVDLPQNGNNDIYRRSLNFSSNHSNEVWHSIKINNNCGKPFTTGTAMVTKLTDGKRKPISEDKLTYTPDAGHSFLKLTTAPEVNIVDNEKEVSRVANKKKDHNGYYYDLVTVEGEVRVKNYKDKKIDLNIRRAVVGKLTSSAPDWKTSKQVTLYGTLNEVNDVCWEIKMGANESKLIKYKYEILIRH
jgi:hypothetical protein